MHSSELVSPSLPFQGKGPYLRNRHFSEIGFLRFNTALLNIETGFDKVLFLGTDDRYKVVLFMEDRDDV